VNPYELRQKFQNFVQTSAKPWYKVVNQVDGPSQVFIYNSIGGLGVSADDFINDLNKIVGSIDVRINSEGGEVFQAKAIYNALASRPDISVYVDGLAASAASFIAMAASPGKLYMSAVSSLMIHDGHTLAMGNAADIRALADVLDRESNTIAGMYAERAGKEVEYFRNKMRAETWYSASEALVEGLCDGIIDPRTGKISNSAAVKITDAAHHGYVGRHEHSHEPLTGIHSHNHAAFGHEDHDDGMHAHAHVHDGDADHEHEHMTHSHTHDHDESAHHHAHDAGQDDWGPHEHEHTHHATTFDPDHDGDNDATAEGDTDHDYAGRDHAHPTNKLTDADFFDDGTPIILASSFPEAVFYDRTFSTAERKRLAKSGGALRNGSYPIETCQDAMNARRAYGRANDSDRSSVAAHIRSREKSLGGCGRDTFAPGSGTHNTNPLVISDEEAATFAANLKL
jgi:ATP-dependent protease ClpP protease subunit